MMTGTNVTALRRDPDRERVLLGNYNGQPVRLNVDEDVQNHQRVWLQDLESGAFVPNIDDEPTTVQVFTTVRDGKEYVVVAESDFGLVDEEGRSVNELAIATLPKRGSW